MIEVRQSFLLALPILVIPAITSFAGDHFSARTEEITPKHYLVPRSNQTKIITADDHLAPSQVNRAGTADIRIYTDSSKKKLGDWQAPFVWMAKQESPSSPERNTVTPELVKNDQYKLKSAILSPWQTMVPIPSKEAPSAGEPELPSAELLKSFLGEPSITAAGSACKAPDGTILSALVATRDVGPFTTQLIIPALDSLERIMDVVKQKHPDLYSEIETAGGACVRLVRGSDRILSTHSWGTAIDITIGGQVTQVGSNKTQAGLIELAKEFAKEGWVWGAYFGRPNPMHFSVGADQLQKWKSEGFLDVGAATP